MPRTLSIRSSGDDVRFLQEQLNSPRPLTARPLLTPDGKFGAKTRARVQEYQGNNALTVDWILGPFTWGSLADLGAGIARAVYDGLGPMGGAR
jgi:peptidoglycan hydrolase-like protein with peptidoglycan-binding domain